MDTDDYIEFGDNGRRVGQTHHKSILLNSTIELIRDYRENQNKSYGWIALKLGVKKDSVAKICRYERRATTTAKLKKKGLTCYE